QGFDVSTVTVPLVPVQTQSRPSNEGGAHFGATSLRSSDDCELDVQRDAVFPGPHRGRGLIAAGGSTAPISTRGDVPTTPSVGPRILRTVFAELRVHAPTTRGPTAAAHGQLRTC